MNFTAPTHVLSRRGAHSISPTVRTKTPKTWRATSIRLLRDGKNLGRTPLPGILPTLTGIRARLKISRFLYSLTEEVRCRKRQRALTQTIQGVTPIIDVVSVLTSMSGVPLQVRTTNSVQVNLDLNHSASSTWSGLYMDLDHPDRQ